ncbi:hypothetical protein PpBr36_02491 [Pyricularia pennisetigena]|uniref:hypothetical protein n=1 Tax=Pyricularia pennisetigena TaxID=1578925 RepID=UPI0011506B5A|nr:hypothetical protein PpBr36_02491 [Pyricularia pennisetigena]TLS31416.1 hypothetical protein PpBr36_02491 [Pyricularia pennisetigena]
MSSTGDASTEASSSEYDSLSDSESMKEEPVNPSPESPKQFPTTGFKILDPGVKIEEERFAYYEPNLFYPVHIGDVLNDRYQVITKLGYGSVSTLWLAKDLNEHRYVTLKVYVHGESSAEFNCYYHFQSGLVCENHRGRLSIRIAESRFQLEGPGGTHDVFVLLPLSLCVRALQLQLQDRKFREAFVVIIARAILEALDYLHTHAKVIHGDVHGGNILLKFSDDSAVSLYEQVEFNSPSPRKIYPDGRIIHVTQQIYNSRPSAVLCDFSSARICPLDQPQTGMMLMPEQYRPPEVILEMEFSYKIDMWCLAIALFRMLTNRSVFPIYSDDDPLSEARHLAAMVSLMGPPPLSFYQKSEKAHLYWDDNCEWVGPVDLFPRTYTLESMLPRPMQGEPGALFLDFMRQILRWEPDDRLDAASALRHPFAHRLCTAEGLVPIQD